MLNSTQLAVLKLLLTTREELITDLAQDENISDPLITVGVGNFIVGNSENFSKMTSAQKYHYNTVLKPLIVDVPCDGMLGILDEDGASSCQGTEFIADEDLLEAYQFDNMRCEACNYTYATWQRNNP